MVILKYFVSDALILATMTTNIRTSLMVTLWVERNMQMWLISREEER